MSDYLFTSERLGFREWKEADRKPFALLNADPVVMEYFLSPLDTHQSNELVDRIIRQYVEHGFCLYAVDELSSGKFIGFIGIMLDTMGIDVSPCVEIGWRLDRSAWNKGYATEGANRCLIYAFEELDIKEIYACTAETNTKSESVMKKIGMTYVNKFKHPGVPLDHSLNVHVLYRKSQF